MSNLIVNCPGGHKRDSTRVVKGMIDLFSQRLTELGRTGKWSVELYKKTGTGVQDRLIFKRVFKDNQITGGKSTLMYHARPLDRDSAWLVFVEPPTEDDGFAVVEAEMNPKKAAPPAEAPKQDAVPALCENHVHRARISRHANHGIEIEIGEDNQPGFIPLADLCVDGKYDKKAINKYTVGKVIKVVICDASKSPIVCSIRVDSVLSTSHAMDMFTGVPDKEGHLSLKGFTRDYKRVYRLIEWLASNKEEHGEVMSKEVALKLTEEFMALTYGSKTLDTRGAGAILSHLCEAVESLPEPMLQKSVDGYSLTEFAWIELGLKPQAPVAVIEVAPEPEPVPETPREERDQAPATVDSIIDVPPLEDLIKYAGMALRYAQVCSSIDAILREKAEIEEWLSANGKLKRHADSLRELVA